MELNPYIFPAVVGLSLCTVVWSRLRHSHSLPLPPGPKPDPLVGNIRNFPEKRWLETFSAWQKVYGDFIYLNVFGRGMIVINSLDIARELLVKRGISGRRATGMLIDVMDWGWSSITAPPGPFHSESRTIFRKAIGPQEVVHYDALIQEECDNLLDALQNLKGDPSDVIQSYVGATVIRVAYGDSIYKEHGTELVELNRETIELASWVTSTFWPVDYLPFLHYLPDWLPLPFKAVGKRGRMLTKRLQLWPWEQTVKHFKAGTAGPSIASEYLERSEKLETVRDTLAIMFGAGVDNTAATVSTFIATILLYPEIQRKIQAELDRELGDVAPTLNDRPRLQYLEAAWKESMRMNPSAPLGVPHCATEEDTYNGMLIPKDTVLLTNMGFMGRDPRVWGEDADRFKPERWLQSPQPGSPALPDISEVVFGFGRRICPGRYLADRTGFIFAAGILKAYEILPLEGETAPKEILFRDLLIRFPENLRCRFMRRLKA